jgi:spore coat protein CotH
VPGADGSTVIPEAGGDAVQIDNPCGEVDPSLATASADALFDGTSIPTFDLYLPAESWQWLNDHAREETFVQAQACFNGKAIGLVGLRFKGNYGSLLNCFNAAGQNICRKLGMKIKFDENVSGQLFHGLKRINFQGYRWDDSYMKEKVAYDLYRAMGIVAPRAAWAKLRVNGEERGLFGMVEQIDGRFAKDRFPSSPEGNLFKEVWPGQNDESALIKGLETNDKAPDVTAMKAFSEALNGAADADLRSTLGQYVDLDYMARFMAVDDAVANFDGPTTWYTSGTGDGAGNHNFFLYEESAQRFTLIPWDLESTLSLASNYGNIPQWQTYPADCTQTYSVWGGQNRVIAPGCDRVFRALASDLTSYGAAARTLLDTHFTVDRMRTQIDTWTDLIAQAANADPHGPGLSKFKDATALLKQEIPRLRARLEHIISGAPTVPAVLSVSKPTDFEGLEAYSLIAGTAQMSNGNSTTSVDMNTADPLAGSKTCRFSFDFGNADEPWQQWGWYQIPMDNPPTDFTGWKGLRLTMRANDEARQLRLEMVSPRNSAAEKGIQMGWDLEVGKTSKTFEVLFADAVVPSWATDPGDPLSDILKTVVGLMFNPQCQGRDSSGQLPEGTRDVGWIDIDDIEFIKE